MLLGQPPGGWAAFGIGDVDPPYDVLNPSPWLINQAAPHWLQPYQVPPMPALPVYLPGSSPALARDRDAALIRQLVERGYGGGRRLDRHSPTVPQRSWADLPGDLGAFFGHFPGLLGLLGRGFNSWGDGIQRRRHDAAIKASRPAFGHGDIVGGAGATRAGTRNSSIAGGKSVGGYAVGTDGRIAGGI
jgi:hypothetical protein